MYIVNGAIGIKIIELKLMKSFRSQIDVYTFITTKLIV